MTERQRAAIANLERAFARLAAAGVALCAMDNTLLAYDKADLTREADRLTRQGGLYAAQRLLIEAGQGILVDTHRAHLDSGGW